MRVWQATVLVCGVQKNCVIFHTLLMDVVFPHGVRSMALSWRRHHLTVASEESAKKPFSHLNSVLILPTDGSVDGCYRWNVRLAKMWIKSRRNTCFTCHKAFEHAATGRWNDLVYVRFFSLLLFKGFLYIHKHIDCLFGRSGDWMCKNHSVAISLAPSFLHFYFVL